MGGSGRSFGNLSQFTTPLTTVGHEGIITTNWDTLLTRIANYPAFIWPGDTPRNSPKLAPLQPIQRKAAFKTSWKKCRIGEKSENLAVVTVGTSLVGES